MKNTTENNRLIAEFMGYKVIKNPPIIDDVIVWHKGIDISFPDNTLIESNLVYHNDWNWLMSVVEKIANIKGFHDIESDLANTKATAKIEDVYSSCISFIEWYNENKTEA